jgi:glucose-1-phosphate thymidylyltransferase
MATLRARAHARVGLLGNPSDLYRGRGLGFAVRELGATVTLADADALQLEGGLLQAGWRVFARELGVDAAARPFRLTATSDVPFQSGLAGSSALLVAALRAWSAWFEVPLARGRIAELAWRVENDELGIRAGPLDRLVQAHEGLLALDFAEPWDASAVERLDPALLPPLLLAWHGAPTRSSGDVHAGVFARWQAGDARVREVTAALAANADDGRAALEVGERAAFLACVDRNLALRQRLFELAPEDLALIELGRGCGAAAKLPGSGGAVLFACGDEDQCARVERACRERGHTTLRPSVALPEARVRAVFLAAGFATRLWPLTRDRAKPLLEVGGAPMLSHVLRQVERVPGVRDGVVVANARFHADFVAWRRATQSRIALDVLDDGAESNEARLGAVGDLALALETAPADVDAWLVLACDNLFEFDLARLVERFAARGRGQLVVRRVPEPVPPSRYSEVVLDGERVASFREKPADPRSDLSAIAVYLLPADLPEQVHTYLAEGGNPDAPGHLLAWLAARTPIEAVPLAGRWLDIGSADDLARAARELG